MLYSKFGTRISPISKTQDASGRVTIQATAEDTAEIREYLVGDLKADDGLPEINALVEKLPWKVYEKAERRRQNYR